MLLQNANSSPGILGDATQITNVAWQSINNLITGIVARLPFIIAGILAALVFYFFAKIVKKIFLAPTTRVTLDDRLRLLFGRLIVDGMTVLAMSTALTAI